MVVITPPSAPIFVGSPPGDGTLSGWAPSRINSNYKNNPRVRYAPTGRGASGSSVYVIYTKSFASSPVNPTVMRLYYSKYAKDSNPTLVQSAYTDMGDYLQWNVGGLDVGTAYYFTVAVTNPYATSLSNVSDPIATLDI